MVVRNYALKPRDLSGKRPYICPVLRTEDGKGLTDVAGLLTLKDVSSSNVRRFRANASVGLWGHPTGEGTSMVSFRIKKNGALMLVGGRSEYDLVEANEREAGRIISNAKRHRGSLALVCGMASDPYAGCGPPLRTGLSGFLGS